MREGESVTGEKGERDNRRKVNIKRQRDKEKERIDILEEER